MSKRRWLRPKPRISYFEPEEPNLDEYVFCEKCGDYVYEYCSIHGALLVIPDDKVPAKHNFPSFVPRAALTIPKVFLHLNYSSIPGAGLGVYTTLTLPKGVRFGPYRGIKTQEITSDYSWQIYDRDRKPSHVVDASDGNKSNWMRFVNCARHWHEQNLVAFQYQGELYYRTIKIVPRFTELLVFYGSEFARTLRLNLARYNAPRSYAQKFGAPIPKKRNINTENKKIIPTKEKGKEISQPTTCDIKLSPPPASRGKKCNKRSKENISESQKEAPTVKKRKTKTEIKKVQSEKTFVKSERNIQSVPQKKKHVIKLAEDVVKEQRNAGTDINIKLEAAKCDNNQLNLGNNLRNTISENIPNPATDFTKPVGNGATPIDKSIGKENKAQETICKKVTKQQNVELNKQDAYFMCNNCNYQAVTKDILERHMRFHDVDRKFACDACGYRFSKISYLNSHKLRHNTNTSTVKTQCNVSDFTTIQQNNSKNNALKLYSCDMCNYKSYFTTNLKNHLRTHTKEKPYICTVCDHKFTQASSLKKHLRIHTGDKPYYCSICNHKFSNRSNLKTHLKTHTGEKPYSCDICKYKCAHTSSLKNHLKRKHLS